MHDLKYEYVTITCVYCFIENKSRVIDVRQELYRLANQGILIDRGVYRPGNPHTLIDSVFPGQAAMSRLYGPESLNSLPNDKILDLIKRKAFADNKSNVV